MFPAAAAIVLILIGLISLIFVAAARFLFAPKLPRKNSGFFDLNDAINGRSPAKDDLNILFSALFDHQSVEIFRGQDDIEGSNNTNDSEVGNGFKLVYQDIAREIGLNNFGRLVPTEWQQVNFKKFNAHEFFFDCQTVGDKELLLFKRRSHDGLYHSYGFCYLFDFENARLSFVKETLSNIVLRNSRTLEETEFARPSGVRGWIGSRSANGRDSVTWVAGYWKSKLSIIQKFTARSENRSMVVGFVHCRTV